MIRSLDSFRPAREQAQLNEQRASMRVGLLIALAAAVMAAALQFNGHVVSSYWAVAVTLAGLAVGVIDARRVRRLEAALQQRAWASFDGHVARLSTTVLEALARDSRVDPETRNRLRLIVERRQKTPAAAPELAVVPAPPVRQPERLKQAA